MSQLKIGDKVKTSKIFSTVKSVGEVKGETVYYIQGSFFVKESDVINLPAEEKKAKPKKVETK